MALATYNPQPEQAGFIQDVIEFIDQPLSPTSLHKLKKSCKQQPGYRERSLEKAAAAQSQGPQQIGYAGAGGANGAGGAYGGSAAPDLTVQYPVGSEIEAQHLHNTTEFNGLRGYCIGHQDDKVLVQFHGGQGQVFDIPAFNLRVVTAPPGAAASPAPAAPPAVAPSPGFQQEQSCSDFAIGVEIEAQHLSNTKEFNGLKGYVVGHQDEKVLVEFHGGNGQVFDIPPPNLKQVGPAPLHSYGAPAATTTAASPSIQSPEGMTLQAKLRCALSHVEAAREAMIIASQLHSVDPESLYTTIADFQPTLSRANIAKNWAKVIQIYQAHADKVEAVGGMGGGAPAPDGGSQSRQAPETAGGYSPAGGGGGGGDDDLTHNLEGVINFIDAPLSPRTLREVRTIRHSLSPKRDRQSASPAQIQQAPQQPAQPQQQQVFQGQGYYQR